MFRLIYDDARYGVKGWVCSSSDITSIASLDILTAQHPNLQSSSYVKNIDKDTANSYIFNADTKTWRLQS